MRQPVRAAGTRWRPGLRLDLQFHHTIGGKGQQLADKVPVRPFSINSIRAILSSIIVVSCTRFSFATEP